MVAEAPSGCRGLLTAAMMRGSRNVVGWWVKRVGAAGRVRAGVRFRNDDSSEEEEFVDDECGHGVKEFLASMDELQVRCRRGRLPFTVDKACYFLVSERPDFSDVVIQPEEDAIRISSACNVQIRLAVAPGDTAEAFAERARQWLRAYSAAGGGGHNR